MQDQGSSFCLCFIYIYAFIYLYKQLNDGVLLGKTDATHWKSVYVKPCCTSDNNNDGILQYTEEASS